jgi:hypothetical protein
MPIIPALRGLGQEDLEFKASLGYVVSFRLAWVDCSSKKKFFFLVMQQKPLRS